MLLIDAHVHIHDCYDVTRFFSCAYDNFKARASSLKRFSDFTGVLMMTESSGENNFKRFYSEAICKNPKNHAVHYSPWSFRKTGEDNSLIVTDGKRKLILIAGHQVAAAEDLEVLMIGTTRKIEDGLPIAGLLEKAHHLGALRVIPWGAGKWLFSRGELLTRIIGSADPNDFFLGDESGRPLFWPTPRHFKYAAGKGIRNLPGTDPLPFPKEVNRAGSFGCCVQAVVDWSRPAAGILEIIRHPESKLLCYGKLEGPLRFLRNQFGMQKRKRSHTPIQQG